MNKEETVDNILKDLVLMTKLIKIRKFTPEMVQDLLRQYVQKYSISILSDILYEKQFIENRYNIDHFTDDNLIEVIFNRLIKIIEKYSKDKVRVWSTECGLCGFVWEDIIYKIPHDAICPSCKMKNATITKIEDSKAVRTLGSNQSK